VKPLFGLNDDYENPVDDASRKFIEYEREMQVVCSRCGFCYELGGGHKCPGAKHEGCNSRRV